MADSSQETTNENMEIESDSTGEQPSQNVIAKVMEKVQQMVEQSKFTVLHQVIELSIEYVNQKKEIMKLQQTIKKVLEERMQTKSDLFIQHNFQKNVQQIEDLKHETSMRLREKLETINGLIKSNEALRLQLKEDDALARLEMDEIKKHLDELSEKANFLEHALKKGENRLKDLNQQVHNTTVEKDKLQQECDAKACEMSAILSKQAEVTQKMKAELMENKARVQKSAEELQREQQKLREQTNAVDQLKAEKELIHNNFLQLKQTAEAELVKKKEHYTKQIEFMQKSFDDMKAEKDKVIEDMTKNIENLNAEKIATDECIKELNTKRSKLADDLQNSKERSIELKQELENYKRNKQRNLELAQLKLSVKQVKTDAKKVAATNKPNQHWNFRPKKNVFIKATETHEEKSKNPPICAISDSDQSGAFETSAYFDGKF